MTTRAGHISRSDISFKQGNPTTGESQASARSYEAESPRARARFAFGACMTRNASRAPPGSLEQEGGDRDSVAPGRRDRHDGFDDAFERARLGDEAEARLSPLQAFLEDKVFDAAIDKGCLDALFCSDVPQRNVMKYLQEVERALSPRALSLSRG